MFSSIGYLTSLQAVQQAIACFRRHLEPAGVILVEPWFPPDKLQSGHRSKQTAEAGGMHIERTSTTEIDGRTCRLRFDYAIRHAGTTQTISETHILGLYTDAEMRSAFVSASLQVRHETTSPSNRGLYIAQPEPEA